LRFPEVFLYLEKSITETSLQTWSFDCTFIGMDYEKMRAMGEAKREEPQAERASPIKEFPNTDSTPDWKLLDNVAKKKIAA
jgi:hypothetical protein